MDTVVQAFSNLLDGLMQDDMRDVSADMTVMKSLMEQEGLTAASRARSPETAAQIPSAANRKSIRSIRGETPGRIRDGTWFQGPSKSLSGRPCSITVASGNAV